MKLVEYTEDSQPQQPPNVYTRGFKDEDISAPHTLQNMDQEMKNILADTTTDINEKCLKYHQVLQRYLGFIKRMRHGGHLSSENAYNESEKDPPSCATYSTVFSDQESRRFSGGSGVEHRASTPKIDSSKFIELPIRIRNRILRRERARRCLKKKETPSINSSATLMETMDDDDDDDYQDVLNTEDAEGDSFITTSGAVVNGWVKSNIEK